MPLRPSFMSGRWTMWAGCLCGTPRRPGRNSRTSLATVCVNALERKGALMGRFGSRWLSWKLKTSNTTVTKTGRYGKCSLSWQNHFGQIRETSKKTGPNCPMAWKDSNPNDRPPVSDIQVGRNPVPQAFSFTWHWQCLVHVFPWAMTIHASSLGSIHCLHYHSSYVQKNHKHPRHSSADLHMPHANNSKACASTPSGFLRGSQLNWSWPGGPLDKSVTWFLPGGTCGSIYCKTSIPVTSS